MTIGDSIKSSKLKPVWNETHKAWRLNIPASLSVTRKRRQEFYPTKAAAQVAVDQYKARRDSFGGSLSSMSPARIGEAAECFKLLAPLNVTLLDATRDYIVRHNQRISSVSLETLFDLFMDAKAGAIHPKYLRNFKQARNRFPEFNRMIAADIQTSDLERALDGVSGGARNAFLRQYRAVFNFGIDRGYLTVNPVRKSSFVARPRQRKEILDPGQVQTIFDHALEHHPAIVPYLVVTFFAGVRPEDEANAIHWDDVGDLVTVRESKTADVREIPLSSNAQAWLNAYGARGGVRSGRLVSVPPARLWSARRSAYAAAGIPTIPQDTARHSFASYWLPVHGYDLNRLVELMGHTSTTMLRNHYLNRSEGVRAKAESFWRILPKMA